MDPMDFRRRPLLPEDEEETPKPTEAGYQPYGDSVPLAKGISDKPVEQDLVRDYITKKYNLGDQYKQLAQDDADVKKAREEAESRKRTVGVLEGINKMFVGNKTDSGFYNNLRQDADAKASQAEKDRKHRLEQFLTTDRLQRTDVERERQDEEYASAKSREQAMNDPNSEESKLAQQLAKKFAPSADVSTLTAAQFQDKGKYFQAMFEAEQRRRLEAQRAADRAKDREVQAGSIADTRAKDLARKQDLDLDKKVNKYSTTVDKSGIPTATNTLQNIKAMLPAEGDIPGYGMADGLKPDWMAGDDGRAIRQEVANLFNVVLKDRSGAAVTDNELNRLKQEFGSGSWKTEKQLRDGIRRYEERLAEVIRNFNAGTDPAALQEYQKRGGQDFSSLVSGTSPSKPKVKSRLYSPSRDQTKIIYEDGTEEVVSGKR